jgi:hypothetical protein
MPRYRRSSTAEWPDATGGHFAGLALRLGKSRGSAVDCHYPDGTSRPPVALGDSTRRAARTNGNRNPRPRGLWRPVRARWARTDAAGSKQKRGQTTTITTASVSVPVSRHDSGETGETGTDTGAVVVPGVCPRIPRTCFFAGQAIVRPGRVSAMPRSARVVAAGCRHHVT